MQDSSKPAAHDSYHTLELAGPKWTQPMRHFLRAEGGSILAGRETGELDVGRQVTPAESRREVPVLCWHSLNVVNGSGASGQASPCSQADLIPWVRNLCARRMRLVLQLHKN